MRIIKTSKDKEALAQKRDIANIGCDKCPCCGEAKRDIDYIKEGIMNKGIESNFMRTWAKGIFKTKYMMCDCYKCVTCGAEWESDPYQYR